jgi:hypothetical protein
MKSAFAILMEEFCKFRFVDGHGHGRGREDDIVSRGMLFKEGDLVLEGDRTGIGRCWWREQACVCRRIECGWVWGGQLASAYAADRFVRWGTVFPVVDLAGSDIYKLMRRWTGGKAKQTKHSPAAVHDIPLNGFAFRTRLELFAEIRFWLLAIRTEPMGLTMNV